MAKQIYIAIKFFGRGISSLRDGWDWRPVASRPVRRGVARHFLNVGAMMNAAAARYAEEHREIPVHA